MRLELTSNAIGGFILFVSTMTFLSYTQNTLSNNINFAITIGVILLIFAWTDYFKLRINTLYGFAAMAGFLVGNIECVLYAIPTGLVFLLFAYLTSSNREKAATALFMASLPIALINSYFFPEASPIAWTFIGLMIGVIENAVVEEMAEGDVFIIALYFMALGPLGFIPLAFEKVVGMALYARWGSDEYFYYPLGSAMFITAAPLFMVIKGLVENGRLPSWLFYAHAHGVNHPGAAIVIGAGAAIAIVYALQDVEGNVSIAGVLLGSIAAFVVAIMTFVGIGVVGVYLQDYGYNNLSMIVFLVGLFGAFIAGGGVLILFSQLHYEGRSSIDEQLWWLWIYILGVILSAITLPKTWGYFNQTHGAALVMGLFLPLWFYIKLGEREKKYITGGGMVFYAVLAAIAGLWTGLGMGWILQ